MTIAIKCAFEGLKAAGNCNTGFIIVFIFIFVCAIISIIITNRVENSLNSTINDSAVIQIDVRQQLDGCILKGIFFDAFRHTTNNLSKSIQLVSISNV